MTKSKEENCAIGPRFCEHKSTVWCMQGVMQQKRGELGLYHLGGCGESYIVREDYGLPKLGNIVM